MECKEVHFAKFTGKKIEITNPKSSGLPNTVSVPKKGFDFDKMEVINLEALEYDQPYSDFVLAFKDQLQDCGIHAIYPLLNSENNKFFGFFLFSGSGLVAQYDDEKEFLETVCKFLVNFHLG